MHKTTSIRPEPFLQSLASQPPATAPFCFRAAAGSLRTGFTLIEVLLVLVILVILASFAVTYFTGTRDRANIDAARTQIGLVKSAIRYYHLHMNEYPTLLEELVTSPSDASKASQWAGPYLEKQVPVDPWGRPYQYVAPGKRSPTTFDIWSFGPDGIDGSDDDIGNWQ